MSNALHVRLDVRVSNPLNGAQGASRGAMLKRARERKTLRLAAYSFVAAAVRGRALYRDVERTITITRVAPRPLDQHDGLGAALKPVIDGVADYLGVKDNDQRIEWKLEQRRGRVREYAVEIEIRRRA